MAGFIAMRGTPVLDRHTVAASFGRDPTSFYLVRAPDLHAALTSNRDVGMCGIWLITDRGHFIGYGDRTSDADNRPRGGDSRSVLRWCEESFIRFGGVLSEGDRLILLNDELAGCPLFYSFNPLGEPVVASEAKALLPHLAHHPRFVELGPQRPLAAFGETIFAGVHSVPAGHAVVLERERDVWHVRLEARSRVYESDQAPNGAGLSATQIIMDVLKASVKRMASERHGVAVTLSGGIDSSAVAAIGRPYARRMLSFSVGTSFGDEFAKAREIAAFLDTDHHELRLTADDVQRLLPELIWSLETYDPLTLQIQMPLAFLFRSVQGYVSTLLTGYGADLIFAGVADRSLPEAQLELRLMEDIDAATRSNEFSPAFAARNGVTVRHPYWCAAMVRAGMRIPARLKVAHDVEKYILRRAVQGCVPPCVAWRAKLGIHQGSSMQRLFAQVLGTDNERVQIAMLKRLAEKTLLRPQRHPADPRPEVDHARTVDLAA